MICGSAYGDIGDGNETYEWEEDMSEFQVPSVDYYHGRKVVAIEDGGEGTGVACWSIRLDGDAVIQNFDPTYMKPDESLVGMGLQASTLSPTQTTLYFGPDNNPSQVSMSLNPTEYAISDPSYTRGELVYPQRSTPVESVPPYPSEREADGPTGEEDEG